VFRPLLLIGLLSLAGCGAMLQTAFGWSREEQRRSTREHEIRVEAPPGIPIFRVDPGGTQLQLGAAPLTDRVPFEVDETVEIPNSTTPMLIGSALDVGVAIAGAVLLASGTDRELRSAGGVVIAEESLTRIVAGTYLMVYAGGAAIADLVFALVMRDREESIARYQPVGGGVDVTYLATPPSGPQVAKVAQVPWTAKVELPIAAPVATEAPPAEVPGGPKGVDPPSEEIDPFAPPAIP
jgi:hypothetical protein